MTRMTGVRLSMLTSLAVLLALGLTPAVAQPLSLDEAKTCICLDDASNRLGQELAARTSERDRQQAELQRMDKELARRYGRVNTDEELEVEQYKYLYEQRERQQTVVNDLTTAMVNVSNHYNRVVAIYNAQCSGHLLPKSLADQARQNLQCPIQP